MKYLIAVAVGFGLGRVKDKLGAIAKVKADASAVVSEAKKI